MKRLSVDMHWSVQMLTYFVLETFSEVRDVCLQGKAQLNTMYTASKDEQIFM